MFFADIMPIGGACQELKTIHLCVAIIPMWLLRKPDSRSARRRFGNRPSMSSHDFSLRVELLIFSWQEIACAAHSPNRSASSRMSSGTW